MNAEQKQVDRYELDQWRKVRAQVLQRKGYTFTEIAQQIGVDRGAVVNALYYDAVRK